MRESDDVGVRRNRAGGGIDDRPWRALACLAALVAAPSAAAEVSSQGSVSVEARAFDSDPDDIAEDRGLTLRSDLSVRYRNRPWQARLGGYARTDVIDDSRDLVLLEDAYVGYSKGPLRVRAGAQVLSWSATDAFHPADVMNSWNFDSDLESPDKFGEPMVELRLRLPRGTISGYYMPYRMEPNLPDARSRMSLTPPGVVLGDALWIGRDGEITEDRFEHQWAADFTYTIGPSDISLHVVQANDRYQPSFAPTVDSLRPVYHMVSQAGGTYVRVIGRAIVKLEGAYRFFDSPGDDLGIPARPDHGQVAGGVEYTWLTGAGHEATVMVEGQTLLLADEEERADLHIFQRDAFVAYRHAFNDPKAREIFAFFMVDLERTYEYLASVRYSQRLSDLWTVETAVRSFQRPPNGFHQFQFTLTRNF